MSIAVALTYIEQNLSGLMRGDIENTIETLEAAPPHMALRVATIATDAALLSPLGEREHLITPTSSRLIRLALKKLETKEISDPFAAAKLDARIWRIAWDGQSVASERLALNSYDRHLDLTAEKDKAAAISCALSSIQPGTRERGKLSGRYDLIARGLHAARRFADGLIGIEAVEALGAIGFTANLYAGAGADPKADGPEAETRYGFSAIYEGAKTTQAALLSRSPLDIITQRQFHVLPKLSLANGKISLG